MDKKVKLICKHPLGIIPCTNDPDIYNVFSFSSDQRIVDMLFFECSCPRKDRSLCSHIRAIASKFHNRYSRELFTIFKVINETNVKNSLSTCIDKAENHQILLNRSINKHFKLNDILDESESNCSGLKQKYKRIIVSILKVLSSISWRHYLIKTKNQTFFDSINNVQSTRDYLSLEKLLESIDLSISSISSQEYSSSVDFFIDLEKLSLEKLEIKKQISIVDFFQRLIKGNKLTADNKGIIIKNMVKVLNTNDVDLILNVYTRDFETKKVENINFSRFLQKVAKVLKRYQLSGNQESELLMDLILFEVFGVSFEFIGIENKAMLDKLLVSKNNSSFNPLIVDAITLKPQIKNLNEHKINEINSISISEITNIIYFAPILVNLYDYLLWFSTGKNLIFGDLGDFIEDTTELEKLNSFFFLRFSYSNKVFFRDAIESSILDNKISIYKIIKPNNGTNITTHNYYYSMIESIINCNAKNTINYFIGGCLQENSLDGFISLFTEEQLLSDITETENLILGFDQFFISILEICPPIFMADIWKYIIYPLRSIVPLDEEGLKLLLLKLFENSSWFSFNNLLQIMPSYVLKELKHKIYNIGTTIDDLIVENSGLGSIFFPPNFEFIEDETHVNIGICKKCLVTKVSDKLDKSSFISSIQRRKFGFSSACPEFIANFSMIIEQSCKNLSLKLYSKIHHYIHELIQNADDNEYCSCIGRLPTVVFVYYSDGVLLLNNEIGFNEVDIESICNIGSSSKKSSNKIGCFGIGFKSVFSITDTPYIFSNGFNIKFNSKSINGAYIFPEWVNNDINFIIPSHIQNSNFEFEFLHYQTKFWLPFKNSYTATKAEIEDDLILFTNNLKRIKVINKDNVIIITKHEAVISDELILIKIRRRVYFSELMDGKKRRPREDKDEVHRKFLIVRFNLEKYYENKPKILHNSIRNPIISIGVELSNNNDSFDGMCITDNAKVYSFLPIKECGFRFLVNADFELTTSRESISVDSNWNIFIRNNITNAILLSIKIWCDLDNFPLLKKSFINLLPSKNDLIDPFFSPIVQDIIKGLYFRKYIFTMNYMLTYPRNSVFIDKTKSSYRYFLKLFPNIDEFSYLLNKYCQKQLIYNFLVDARQKLVLQDLGVHEFNIGMLVDILHGLIHDFSYFGRNYNWYFNLFLLLEDYFINTDGSNKFKCKLQHLPLLITENDQYVEYLKPETNKKQLFLSSNNFPSIPKLNIHFVKNKFLNELRDYFGNELFYNKVINFINFIGPYYIDSSEYVNIILENMTKVELNPDELILYTSIIANLVTNKQEILSKKLFVVNSNDEILPLSKFFVLFNEDSDSNISENIVELFNFDPEITCSYNIFFNVLSPKYIKYGNVKMWNTFFSFFGLTHIPFSFKELKINMNNICNVREIYKRYCLFDDFTFIEHLKNLNFVIENNGETVDYICSGIDVLSSLMNKLLQKYSNNIDLKNLIFLISCNLYKLFHRHWEEIKVFWELNAHNFNYKSFACIQFTNYPLFASVSVFQNNFIFKGLSSSRKLTFFKTAGISEIISKFVNFLYISPEDQVDLNILEKALGVYVNIDIEYLVLLLNSIRNKNGNYIDLVCVDKFYIDDYIHIIDAIVCFSKKDKIQKIIFNRNDFIFPYEKNKEITWKSLNDLFWEDDEKIIPEELSLSYIFENTYDLSSSLCEFFNFFVTQHGVSLKPTDRHLNLWLSNMFNNNNFISRSSSEFLVYSTIISRLINFKFDKIRSVLHIPVFVGDTEHFKWVKYDHIKKNENEFLFSSSPYFYYLFHGKKFFERNVIWSPYFSLFSMSYCIPEGMTVYFDSWNSLFSKSVTINVDGIDSITDEIGSLFYSNFIFNFLGPLLEGSMKDRISMNSRINWRNLVNGKINILYSNLNVKFLSYRFKLTGFFDIETGSIYSISPSKITSDQGKRNVILSLLLFVDSFFDKSRLNSNYFIIANNVLNSFDNLDKLEQIDIAKSLGECIRKVEYDLNESRIDMNYLFSNYIEDQKVLKFRELSNNQSKFEVNRGGIKNILKEIGRKGEELGYHYLLEKYERQVMQKQLAIFWVNENEETGLPYDLLMTFNNPEDGLENFKIYVEVKSSSNRNKESFHITTNEWEFARIHRDYWILLISGIKLNNSNESIGYRVIKNPHEKWKTGNLQMILSTNELKQKRDNSLTVEDSI
ncbi:hypothetical protein FG386_000829 [Cryptosporidium ryanae]|uniref:uncharacterized protein n=1 Tax=Cryptosporidium ryanae TaxID=515981 RepID=UPI003519F708|nr:hypothetical protein FG386_000829 [Cryptosporidium ryanae]